MIICAGPKPTSLRVMIIIVLLLFLQKQNLVYALSVTHHLLAPIFAETIFGGPSINDSVVVFSAQ